MRHSGTCRWADRHRDCPSQQGGNLKQKKVDDEKNYASLLIVFAVTRDAYDITPAQLWRVLTGASVGPAGIVIWKIRMPRIVSAIVAGPALVNTGGFILLRVI